MHGKSNIKYNISIDKVGKSKQNETLLRYKESKERQQVSALFIVRPSSGLPRRTKKESQCYLVHNFIVCYIKCKVGQTGKVLHTLQRT